MSSNLKQVVSISFDAASVKVAAVKSNGTVLKIAKETIVDADVSGALKKALSGFNIKKSGIICVLPSDVATTKNIEVPATDPAEIDSIINLQAGRYTPFSKEEILIGYNNIGSYQANHTKVLLVIVKQDIVREKLSVLSTVGIEVDQVSFAPEGIAKLYSKSKVKKERSPMGIIDVGYDRTSLIIESRSNVVLSRSIPVGVKHLRQDTEGSQNKIIEEIKATIDTYKSENVDVVPSRFIVTSDFDVVTALHNQLNESLEAVVDVAPFSHEIKAGKAIQSQLQQFFSDDSLLEVIAAGANSHRAEINLLPDEVQLKKSMIAKSREATVAGILAVMVLVVVGAALIVKVTITNSFYNENLIARYQDKRLEVKNLETRIEQNKIVKSFLKKRFMSLNSLNELYNIIPNDVYITGVNIDEFGNLTLAGVSQSMSRVFSLVTDLEDSELFRNVKTRSTSTRRQNGKDVAGFEIGLKIEGIAKEMVSNKDGQSFDEALDGVLEAGENL